MPQKKEKRKKEKEKYAKMKLGIEQILQGKLKI